MNVALYLRLSESDGDLEEKGRKESYSIENQRLLLQDFVLSHPDLYGELIEYVDDGYTGTNFNRPAFQQMITDAKNGLIQVIIAKDLSRLGRNYVDMGDYLDQIFPRLGVRVIAVGSGYDSSEHVGDVSGMDAAITNFINASYSRDLSVRHRTVRAMLIKKGTPLISLLPYGYRRDPENKTEWVPDGECAEVVRGIFRMAASGHPPMEIVEWLNESKAKLPGDRMEELYRYNPRCVVTDGEYLWDSPKVSKVIKNPVYAGDFVANQSESSVFDMKKVRRVPREEWIIIRDHHVPLVERETYEKAQKIYGVARRRDRGRPATFALKTKLRCGTCHLAFRFYEKNKKFRCSHKGMAGTHSECSQKEYSYVIAENLIFKALKKYLEDLEGMDELTRKVMEATWPAGEEKRKTDKGKVAVLKAERVRQYEGFAQGLITKEAYLEKKNRLTEEISQLESDLKEAEKRQKKDQALLREAEQACDAAAHAAESPFLTRYVANAFIKNVYVFDYDRIEIDYVTDDLLSRIVQRNLEILETLAPREGGEGASHPYDSEYVRRLREINERIKSRPSHELEPCEVAGKRRNDK